MTRLEQQALAYANDLQERRLASIPEWQDHREAFKAGARWLRELIAEQAEKNNPRWIDPPTIRSMGEEPA